MSDNEIISVMSLLFSILNTQLYLRFLQVINRFHLQHAAHRVTTTTSTLVVAYGAKGKQLPCSVFFGQNP
jgi:hypothetical protein